MAPKRPIEVLTLSSDDEDDRPAVKDDDFPAKLAKAIALSKLEAQQQKAKTDDAGELLELQFFITGRADLRETDSGQRVA